MIRFATILSLLIGTASSGLAADDAKDEMKKLAGTWKVSSAEIDGNVFDAKKFGITSIVVADDKLVFKEENKVVVTYAFTVDPTKKPKAMDCVKDKDSMPLPCIYALEGDELKLCMPLLPKKGDGAKVEIKRPKSFATKDIPVLMMVLKQDKK